MAGGYVSQPSGVDALVKKIRDLEGKIAALSRAVSGLGVNIAGGTGTLVFDGTFGGITIAGGTLVVLDPSGNEICAIGIDPLSPTTTGLVTHRADGQLMFASEAVSFLGLVYTGIFDFRGQGVVYDDPIAGGLGRPYLSLGQWVDNTPLGTPAAPTVSATFVTLQVAQVIRANPRVRVDAIVNSSSVGTTGELQLLDIAGVAVGTPLVIPANATSYVTLGPTNWPAAGWATGDSGMCQLQVRRTAGTGTVGVRGIGIWGMGSA